MAADVSPGPEFIVSVPRTLFSTTRTVSLLDTSTWDAMPDGESFVLIEDRAEPRRSVRLMLGWFAELRRSVRRADAGR